MRNLGARALLVLLLIPASGACSMKSMGINRMADALSSTASSYSRDDDPEFVRLAAPSTLKMVEMLLDEQSSHPGLLITACSGFTQYAYAFLQLDAEMAEPSNPAAARELRARAVKMYDRARDYCLRALEVRRPGLRQALSKDVKTALASASVEDVPALFWSGAAWAGSLSVAENQLLRIGEIAMVRALLGRALALDESWQGGVIHEAMIAVDGLPPLLGGSPQRARAHFDAAVSMSHGTSAFAYVTMASSVAQPARDRAEFERLLRSALAIDVSKQPSIRLSNLVAQKRARFLLSQVGRLF
jgi:predicted anti-sigma-YlaC factor YlaD